LNFAGLRAAGNTVLNEVFFDTLKVKTNEPNEVVERARQRKINLRLYDDGCLGVALDETVTVEDVADLLWAFGSTKSVEEVTIKTLPCYL